MRTVGGDGAGLYAALVEHQRHGGLGVGDRWLYGRLGGGIVEGLAASWDAEAAPFGPLPPDMLAHHRGEGFSLWYPKSWQVLTGPETTLFTAGGLDGVTVQVVPMLPLSERNAAVRKRLADALVAWEARQAGEQLADQRPVEVGGVGGFAYLTGFRDGLTGEPGTGLHVALSDVGQLSLLRFKAVPATEIAGLRAKVFRQVLESFRPCPVGGVAQ